MAADYVIVGGGVNALVAAALLGKKGKRVLVLERNDRIGGCIRTEEITAPGFVHDVMATTFVLFVTSPAYGALASDLAARGLEFAHSEFPTGVLLPDGRHQIFSMDRARNVAAFDALAAGDGARFAADMARLGADAPFLFSLLGGSLWSWGMLRIVAREAWKRSSPPAPGSNSAIARHCSGRCGRPGCCIPASARKAPIPGRWPR
jgi:phytoene dehydrogenase-like protein